MNCGGEEADVVDAGGAQDVDGAGDLGEGDFFGTLYEGYFFGAVFENVGEARTQIVPVAWLLIDQELPTLHYLHDNRIGRG